ncbi:unnamed protein product [Malus baccata var. baccata]
MLETRSGGRATSGCRWRSLREGSGSFGEEMLHEIYEKATQEPYETFHGEMVAASACISAANSFQKEITNQVENNEARESTEN